MFLSNYSPCQYLTKQAFYFWQQSTPFLLDTQSYTDYMESFTGLVTWDFILGQIFNHK